MWNAHSGTALSEMRSFDLLPLGLCIVDRQMVVHCWNRSLEQWTGTRREQIVGRAYGSAFGTAVAQALRDRVATALEGDGRNDPITPHLETVGVPPNASENGTSRMKTADHGAPLG